MKFFCIFALLPAILTTSYCEEEVECSWIISDRVDYGPYQTWAGTLTIKVPVTTDRFGWTAELRFNNQFKTVSFGVRDSIKK